MCTENDAYASPGGERLAIEHGTLDIKARDEERATALSRFEEQLASSLAHRSQVLQDADSRVASISQSVDRLAQGLEFRRCRAEILNAAVSICVADNANIINNGGQEREEANLSSPVCRGASRTFRIPSSS